MWLKFLPNQEAQVFWESCMKGNVAHVWKEGLFSQIIKQ